MAVTARKVIAFSQTYGYPEELAPADVVQLPKIILTGLNGLGIDANGQTITNLPLPVNDNDAATKAYADTIAKGIIIAASVRLLADSNQALNGLPTIDGVQSKENDRVLLTAQTTASQNGVWVVHNAGGWKRPVQVGGNSSADYYVGSGVAGHFTFVTEGQVYSERGYVCTSDSGSDIVDTSPLAFTQFTGLGEVKAGNGLTSLLNTISVALATNSGLQFTNGSLDHLLQTYGSLTKNADGLGIKLGNQTLSTDASGLKVLGLPSAFTINQQPVDANVTAANLNTLNDGPNSQADGLHTHLSVLRAQATAANHANGSAALAAGDPVYWSATGDVLARGDATGFSSATIIGVNLTATAANGIATIVKHGVAAGVLTNATPGMPVYLNTGGGLSQVQPSSGVLLQVGFAKSATDLDVAIDYIGRR